MCLKEKSALLNGEVIRDNPFKDCDEDEIMSLWEAMRSFYINGYISEKSPLAAYQQKYIDEAGAGAGLGLVAMELDLLRAMAVRLDVIYWDRRLETE